MKKGIRKRLWGALKGANPWVQGLSALGVVIVAIIAVWLLYTAVHRLFFAGQDVARAHGEAVVAQEQTNAATATGHEAAQEITRTFEYHTEQRTIVREGQDRVNQATTVYEAQQGEIDGLCRLDNSLCQPTTNTE